MKFHRGVTLETARRIQGSEEETGKSPVDYTALPDDADRALGIVKAKLSKDLSLEHRVNELINEATDFNNLALIFSGWQCASTSVPVSLFAVVDELILTGAITV